MARKVYQIKGEFVHFDCLTDSARDTIEVTGIEVLLKDLETDDVCSICGEAANLNGEAEEEPSELEKEDDN